MRPRSAGSPPRRRPPTATRSFRSTSERPTRPREAVDDMATVALDIRRLTYADLPQVIAIERRAFPTPWSLAMFVLEVSKPSGVCLAAWLEGRLAGYLVCSRYDTVWHVMNVAVDPDRRRLGIASTLLT